MIDSVNAEARERETFYVYIKFIVACQHYGNVTPRHRTSLCRWKARCDDSDRSLPKLLHTFLSALHKFGSCTDTHESIKSICHELCVPCESGLHKKVLH